MWQRSRESIFANTPTGLLLCDDDPIHPYASKAFVQLEAPICSIESAKCVQHAMRIVHVYMLDCDKELISHLKGSRFVGVLSCAFCDVRETRGRPDQIENMRRMQRRLLLLEEKPGQ